MERTGRPELDARAGGLPVAGGRSLPARLAAATQALVDALRRHPALIVLPLLALVVIAPLLRPGYFWGAHDARHDVYFLFEYDQAVQEGNWFPRWGQDWAFGYGYPFWIIYAPLGVFVGEAIHHFGGLDWESSVKAVLALSLLLSGIGMYGFARGWLGRKAAFVAAAAYMVFPYHLVDVFVRAALPESLALALFPFVLWAFRAATLRPRWATVAAAGLAYAALMWTHNLSMVLFTPGLVGYVLVLLATRRDGEDARWAGRAPMKGARTAEERREGEGSGDAGDGGARRRGPAASWVSSGVASFLKRAAGPALAAALGLGLSAGFFIPAVLEARNVNQTQWFGQYYSPLQHAVYLHQLFNPSWGFGISQPGPDDVAQGSLSYQLGAVPALLALVGVFAARRLGRGRRRELWYLALWGGIAVFLTLGISAPLWRLPAVPLAQFPWRYLMLAAAPLSVLAGSLVAGPEPAAADAGADRDLRQAWPAAILVALLMLGSYPYLQVEMREPTAEQGPVSYQALMRFQRTSDEMTGVTAWVDPAQRPNWSPMADVWIKGEQPRTRVDYRQVPQNKTLAVNAEGMGTDYEEIYFYTDFAGKSITFNRFWYPGWHAYLLDGRHGRPVRQLPVEREDGPLARVVVPIPQGEGYLVLRFENTPLRAASLGVTYATIALLALAGLYALVRPRWSRRAGSESRRTRRGP